MPLDEPSEVNQGEDGAPPAWPVIDRRLIDDAGRASPPAFPLDLLPERWRGWAAASVQSYTPVDYLAQGLLACVSSVCGGALLVRVSPGWTEPMLLWQALVGAPSTGKTPALAAARRLLDGLEPALDLVNEDFLHGLVYRAVSGRQRGAVLWRDDLASWLASAARGARRADWLAGWNAREADSRVAGHVSAASPRFPLTVVGSLRPERLTESLADDELSARLLYGWPEGANFAALNEAGADEEGARALLQRIAALAGSVRHPSVLPLDSGAVAALEFLLPELHREMRASEGAEAAWIGKGAGTIVRLAGLLTLMRWSESDAAEPAPVDEGTVMDAHTLWSGYFLPHARAVFGQEGAAGADRLARRATRWLRRAQLGQVSRECIRREALARAVNADEADEVIDRLETGGVLRRAATESSGGRRPRRWDVNPSIY